MLRIAYDVVKPILSFHVCTEAEKYFQTPCKSCTKQSKLNWSTDHITLVAINGTTKLVTYQSIK